MGDLDNQCRVFMQITQKNKTDIVSLDEVNDRPSKAHKMTNRLS